MSHYRLRGEVKRWTCTWSFIFNCHNILFILTVSVSLSFSFTECVHCSHHRDICWDKSAISADVGVKEQHHLYCYNTGTTIILTDTHADKVMQLGQLYVVYVSDLILSIWSSWHRVQKFCSFIKIQLIKVAWIQKNQRNEHKHILTGVAFFRITRVHGHQ